MFKIYSIKSTWKRTVFYREEGLGYKVVLKAGAGSGQALHVLPVEEPADHLVEGGIAQS